MHRYGLKLWSSNKEYFGPAEKLFTNGAYHFIELYVVPGTYADFSPMWKSLNVPYVIHAPHYGGGLNLAKTEDEAKNLGLAEEARRFADLLSADKIIFHPGIDGNILETIRQLKLIADSRIIIENKPYNAIGSNLICNGTTPQEIAEIMKAANVGFCLDIGHAICSAKAHNQDYFSYLREFISLFPAIYHLTDGAVDNLYDEHKHIGEGNYDIANILKLLPANALITVETDKDSLENLDDFIVDVDRLKKYDKDR